MPPTVYRDAIPLPVIKTATERQSRVVQAQHWVTVEAIRNSYELPAAQRPLTLNRKVVELASTLRAASTPCLHGTIVIGIVDGRMYIIDGQHRLRAIEESGVPEVLILVAYEFLDSIEDVGRRFVELNEHLVRMMTDNILNGYIASSEALTYIMEHCRFIGTSQIRRSDRSGPMVSLSLMLRCWYGSANDTPSGSAGLSALEIARTMQVGDARNLVAFSDAAFTAFGRESPNKPLWSALNLTLCMWLFRQTVLDATGRVTPLNIANFRAGLRGLAASTDYIDFLVQRKLDPTNRRVTYERLAKLFASRIRQDRDHPLRTVRLPQPEWLNI